MVPVLRVTEFSTCFFSARSAAEMACTLNTGTSTTTFIGMNGTHKVIMGFACEYDYGILLLIHPHHFAHYFESKVGRGLILEHLVSTIHPHQCMDAVKSHSK